MKNMKKIFALVIAMLMIAGMMSAFAAAPATGTITIVTPSTANADEVCTYRIYKIFDASVNATTGAVTYKLMDGVTTAPTGFTANEAGFITDAPSSLTDTTTAFKDYTAKSLVDTVTATGPSANAVSKELAPGYYYVETTTGACVMVKPGGDNRVVDKNELSTLVKSAGSEYSEDAKKVIDAVGTEQDFTIVVTKKHGATKLEVSDTMTGMKLKGVVTVDPADAVVTENTSAADATEFSIKFGTDYVKSLADNATLTLHYTAIITSDALQTNPGKNTATLTTDNNHQVSDDVEVYNAKVTISKVDKDGNPLPGAGFTLYKQNGSSWDTVEVKEAGENITEFEWKGLGVGSYKIEETTVPEGYNKAADFTFTVTEGEYTVSNLVHHGDVTNLQGAELPETGGIGTTLFYVGGGILVLAAIILLVTKKRMSAND